MINEFLNQFGVHLTEHELLAIIRRVDTDCDACIDFVDWSEFIAPLEPPPKSVLHEPIKQPHFLSPSYRKFQL